MTTTIPASSCMHCRSEGIVSTDQSDALSHRMTNRVRFYCDKCLRVWLADRDDALIQGRFLDRARLRPSAVLDALGDAVEAKTTDPPAAAEPATAPSTLRAERLRDLALVSSQLADATLDAKQRRALLQRWADLTLLLADAP